MAKKMTDAARLRCRMAAAMFEIMLLLGWDEEKYFWNQVEAGELYLRTLFDCDHDGNLLHEENTVLMDYDRLRNHKAFWSWWRIEWLQREESWLWAFTREYVEARRKYDDKVLAYSVEVDKANKDFSFSQFFGFTQKLAIPMGPGVFQPKVYTKGELREEYKLLHNARMLAEGITPDAVVLEESYSRDLVPRLK